jgi:rod shape-determining protein MreD
MIFYLLTLVGGYLLQIFLAPAITIVGVTPNLLLIATIFFGLRQGVMAGIWMGFAWGLLADVASLSMFGSQTFMLTLVGYLCGQISGKIDEEKPIAQMALTFFMFLLYVLGLFILGIIFFETGRRMNSPISILQPIYGAVISPIVFWGFTVWYGFGKRFGKRRRA